MPILSKYVDYFSGNIYLRGAVCKSNVFSFIILSHFEITFSKLSKIKVLLRSFQYFGFWYGRQFSDTLTEQKVNKDQVIFLVKKKKK